MWLVGGLSSLPAASFIGMAVANGSFEVDHARVWGNSNLFDGSVVETETASSQLQITGGVQMRLASNTRATVYQNRLVLESGFGQLESAAGYEVEAGSLRISTAASDSVARIRVLENHRVTVAAVRGVVRVANGTGLLVANVAAGSSLDFEPQTAGAAAPTRVSGCLLAKSGKIVIVDQTANVILELQGAGLDQEIGNHVEVVGRAEGTSPSVPGASELIKVVGVKEVSKGGCTAIAKKIGAATSVAAGAGTAGSAAGAAGAAGAGGAAAGAGIGIGTVAVIGGVATAATVGGLAAVGGLPGQGNSPTPVSR
ncbi:MAG TPA: hypothetical protein VKU19_00470 [Bryobacteraceae bacterium]|nr:hypothetical protein [Bryobacteraceae bacterium]